MPHNPKDSSRIRGDARARKSQKQWEAEARHEQYKNLSPESRLARIEGRPGNSERERKRLLSAIESRRKVAAKKEKT